MSDELESLKSLVNVQLTDYLIKRLFGQGALTMLAEVLRDKGKDSKTVFLFEFAGDISLSELAKGPVTMAEGNTYSYAEDGSLDIISRGFMSGEIKVEHFRPLSSRFYISDNVQDEVFDIPLEGELIVRVLVTIA